MVRGIEGRSIFRDDRDRDDFVRRLGEVAIAKDLTIYAWALLPNHFHLLLRTGRTPLARAMRSLLTGYAGTFNRRHGRRGHLFQNRYKSIVVEEEPYLLELVRYIHLNPLRAKLLPDLATLDRYPYAGHAALLGHQSCPWQATSAVLGTFAPRLRRARAAYREFAAAGIAHGRRPELQGGGLIRSLGGWAAVQALRRGREQYVGDERVLGSTEFVAALREDLARQQAAPAAPVPLDTIIRGVCTATGVAPETLRQGSRMPQVCRAREGVAYLALVVCGYPGPRLLSALGVHLPSVHRAAQRGQEEARKWERTLKERK
jgi:REP element-mobilizing transposase RayT